MTQDQCVSHKQFAKMFITFLFYMQWLHVISFFPITIDMLGTLMTSEFWEKTWSNHCTFAMTTLFALSSKTFETICESGKVHSTQCFFMYQFACLYVIWSSWISRLSAILILRAHQRKQLLLFPIVFQNLHLLISL